MASVRPIIPGLSVCPVGDEEGEAITITTMTGEISIPASHRYGNCRRLHEFERLKVIQNGDIQFIYQCRDKVTNENRALKKFNMRIHGGFPKSALREISLLKSLDHINIIHSYGVAAGKKLESNWIILDSWIFSLKDLLDNDVNKIYDKAMVKCIMKQLFCGLDYIHENLIIHRNINPENIVFTETGILKITGFSSSRFFTRGDMTPGITELRYRAPELLLQDKRYTPAVDMWSAGCLLARLVLKDFLFKGSSELEVLRSINKILGTPSENIWAGFSTLLSKAEKGNNIFEEEIPCNQMQNMFGDQSLSLQDLLQDLLIYNPVGRSNAKLCLVSSYFQDEPQACPPEEITSIIMESEKAEEMIDSLKKLVMHAKNNTNK